MDKPNYGIDAPGVIRNFFLAGTAFLLVALLFPSVKIGSVQVILFPGFLWPAGWFYLIGGLMLLYALHGKFRHRERMLAQVPWTGTEQVLDVGAGRGLLLIGAARRLTTGRATGIDIWNVQDLSGNDPDNLLRNIRLEGVTAHAFALSQDARSMGFPDNTFDVVLSNLCLHNIYEESGRRKACQEIARVLKPGGQAVLSDYKHMRDYVRYLAAAGLTVQLNPPDWTGTFPPLRILVAHKPAS